MIGSRLCEILEAQGEEVITCEDRLSFKNILTRSSFYDADFVFFLAFDTGGGQYMKQYEKTYDFLDNNIYLLSSAFKHLSLTKTSFIFVSNYITEDINSIHGNVKLIGERFTRSLNGQIVRLWNVYGGEKKSKKSHVITDFIHQASSEKRIDCKTTGEEQRQFLHVDDCCRGLISIRDNYFNINDKIIDLTSFKWYSIKEVANIISSNFNECELNFGNKKESYRIYYEPNQHILNYWEPEIELEEGIKKLVRNKSRTTKSS